MKDSVDAKLFVVTHKKLNKKYYPERDLIYVGKNADKFAEEGDFKDKDGDNIADKNYTYCECTAIYYIWKNVKCDIAGIEHYRRLFYGFGRIKKKEYFVKNLEKYDFIVMNEYPLFKKNKTQLIKGHGEEAYNILRKAIEVNEPDYLEAFDKVMNETHLAWCNMFVAKKKDFDEYCEFLFKILDYIYDNVEIPEDSYQSRLIGFLSERLLSVYLKKNHKKVKHAFVYYSNAYKKEK